MLSRALTSLVRGRPLPPTAAPLHLNVYRSSHRCLSMPAREHTYEYDLCVIGAGPAGYAAAMRAYDLGKKVLIVEGGKVGGAGVHDGALSSKTLWHLANDYAIYSSVGLGTTQAPSWDAIRNCLRSATREKTDILERQIKALETPSHVHGGQLFLQRGWAKFVAPHAISIAPNDALSFLATADNFLIATGSKPRAPAGCTLDGHYFISSDHVTELSDFPKSMVIVGSGIVGCEFASCFATYGRTRINMIDRRERLLPFEDEDVANVVEKNFNNLGVTVHHDMKLVNMSVVDGMVEYVISNNKGCTETHRVEKALVSIGRDPCTAGLGLETVGVKSKPDGSLEVVDNLRTSVPYIYAAGDATVDVALVNVAELEGRSAVELMYAKDLSYPIRPIRYEALSTIMFLSPEVACVGLNEQQARQKKIPYRVASLDNHFINRYIAMRQTGGFIKLLAEARTDKILGVRVVGQEASSAIHGVAMLIDRGGTLQDIDYCIHPHPAITEGVQEAARILLGTSIHKPEVFETCEANSNAVIRYQCINSYK
eukprot:GILJ01009635.1.p1 GENE.GILJ01009635.1~~GILJ01009635.1.p1  ORF type:complete len:541 (-),score=62.46 GILJ01009635.1:88-1710(-)